MTPERPTLVGLVCWVLIVANSLALYSAMKLVGSPGLAQQLALFPSPFAVSEGIFYGTLAVPLICGICMYEGVGAARYVYLAVMIPHFLQNYFLLPANTVDKFPVAKALLAGEVVLFLISIVILFLPMARRYFHPPIYIDE